MVCIVIVLSDMAMGCVVGKIGKGCKLLADIGEGGCLLVADIGEGEGCCLW